MRTPTIMKTENHNSGLPPKPSTPLPDSAIKQPEVRTTISDRLRELNLHSKSSPPSVPRKVSQGEHITELAKASVPLELKHWLVWYATTNSDGSDERTLTAPGVVEAPDIKAAEKEALLGHVSEAFYEGEEIENESGEWVSFCGFRAFAISEDACAVDAGTVLWIEFIEPICAEDAAILKKHLNRCHTEAEEVEQIKLRGLEKEGK